MTTLREVLANKLPKKEMELLRTSFDVIGDIAIIEVGGTVGEYENILFVEAVRMLKAENPNNVFIAMVSYLPTPSKVGEMKTKPTQHAVRALNSAGVQPDIIIARSDVKLDKRRKEKISTFWPARQRKFQKSLQVLRGLGICE